MDNTLSKYIWAHGYDSSDLARLTASLTEHERLIGTSLPSPTQSAFPQGGLIPALQAAMRGELHVLLVRDVALLGENSEKQAETILLFQSYGVSVKSSRSCSSSNS